MGEGTDRMGVVEDLVQHLLNALSEQSRTLKQLVRRLEDLEAMSKREPPRPSEKVQPVDPGLWLYAKDPRQLIHIIRGAE